VAEYRRRPVLRQELKGKEEEREHCIVIAYVDDTMKTTKK